MNQLPDGSTKEYTDEQWRELALQALRQSLFSEEQVDGFISAYDANYARTGDRGNAYDAGCAAIYPRRVRAGLSAALPQAAAAVHPAD